LLDVDSPKLNPEEQIIADEYKAANYKAVAAAGFVFDRTREPLTTESS